MKRYPTFPQVVFVSVENEASGADYLLAHGNKQEALEHADPIVVGMYKFVEAHKVQSGISVWTKRRTRKTA